MKISELFCMAVAAVIVVLTVFVVLRLPGGATGTAALLTAVGGVIGTLAPLVRALRRQ